MRLYSLGLLSTRLGLPVSRVQQRLAELDARPELALNDCEYFGEGVLSILAHPAAPLAGPVTGPRRRAPRERKTK
jgi:hypothetical protein